MDHPGSGARRVEQDAIKASDDFGELSTVVVAHDDVFASQAVDVGDERLDSVLVGIVGKDGTRVLHQRRQIGGFAAGSRSHVEHAFVGLRCECNAGLQPRKLHPQ